MKQAEKTTRIAKNSMLLYIRMAFSMLIGLYTGRVVLDALGVVDFGIYNVVGGITTMFVFLNTTMSVSTSRYVAYEIGQNNNERIQIIYNQARIIHYCIALIIFLLIESIGLWFIYNGLNIPSARLDSAVFVLHTVGIITVLNVLITPDNALIIAYEKMSAFAYLTIMDVCLKLIFVIVLKYYNGDRLVLYAIIMVGIQILDRICYSAYCHRKFSVCGSKLIFVKDDFLTMLKFAGWNLLGNLANMTLNEGITVVLNVFSGPAVNAARGIAFQLSNHCQAFVNNIRMAVNPQITKSWAEKDYKYMHSLITFSSLSCYYVLFILSAPLYWVIEYILSIWLIDVPDYSADFFKLTLIFMLVNSFANPVILGIHATGDIKKFQIVEGVLMIMTLPFAYMMMKLGYGPTSVYWIMILFAFIAQIGRLYIILPKIYMSFEYYLRNIIIPVTSVTFASVITVSTIAYFVVNGNRNIITDLVMCFITFFSSILYIWYLGLKFEERKNLKMMVKNKINIRIANRLTS